MYLELISISIIDICTVKYDESVHYNSQCSDMVF